MWKNSEPGEPVKQLICRSARRYFNVLLIFTWMPRRKQIDEHGIKVCGSLDNPKIKFTHDNCGADDWLIARLSMDVKMLLAGTNAEVSTVTRDVDLLKHTSGNTVPNLELSFQAITTTTRGDHLIKTALAP